MDRSPIDPHSRDWYSVSVDTLRAWGMLLVLVVLGGIGFLGYRYWQGHDLERRASEVIGEARSLVNRLHGESAATDLGSQYQSAVETLNEASAAFKRSEFASALELGRRSRALLQSILDAAGGGRGGAAAAQFISVQGRVEFRRGDRNVWEEARSRITLEPGDHVRTGSNGSAEIMFLDGNLYTARPNTQLIIARSQGRGSRVGEQSIRMDYGWVNLNTSRQGGKVSTPEAEARVAGDAEATVTYDAEARTGRFAAFRGSMEVASAGGEERKVEALEQVVQRGERLAATEKLLPPPTLGTPDDNATFSLDENQELRLQWEPLEGAQGYALQVSRGHLFVDNVIDVLDRTTTHATLGIRGAGSFVWRVAGIGKNGAQGPWAPARSFRVLALPAEGEATDKEPPPLELEEIKPYGSIFIVAGKTEPGALVDVDGEPVQVEADGTFTKTVQITQEGWSTIEIRARDAAGNETVANPRVFVEIL